ENRQKPHRHKQPTGTSLRASEGCRGPSFARGLVFLALEPFGTQERRQKVDKQQQRHQRGQQSQDHDGSFQTLSHAVTKAKRRPMVANPRTNSAGSQISRFMLGSSPFVLELNSPVRSTGQLRTVRRTLP